MTRSRTRHWFLALTVGAAIYVPPPGSGKKAFAQQTQIEVAPLSASSVPTQSEPAKSELKSGGVVVPEAVSTPAGTAASSAPQATSATQATSAALKTPAADPTATEPFAPWEIPAADDLKPLIREPQIPKVKRLLAFLGYTAGAFNRKMLTQAEASALWNNILRGEKNLKKSARATEKTIRLKAALVKGYFQQIEYLEKLMIHDLHDPKFFEPEHLAKVLYRKTAVMAQALALEAPNAPAIDDWRGQVLLSRLKIGDLSALEPAKRYIESVSNEISHRIALLIFAQTALARVQKRPLEYISLNMDFSGFELSRAALTVYLGETLEARKNLPDAQAAYAKGVEESRALLAQVRAVRPIFVRAQARTMLLYLKTDPQVLQENLLKTLVADGLTDVAAYYAEQVATAQLTAKKVELSLKTYDSLRQVPGLGRSQLLGNELRIFDLALKGGHFEDLFKTLPRIGALLNNARYERIELRIKSLLVVLRSRARAKPSVEEAERFAIGLDAVREAFPKSPVNEEWDLDSLRLLSDAGGHLEVAKRGERIFKERKAADVRQVGLMASMKAYEKILAIKPEQPSSVKRTFSTAETAVARDYLKLLGLLKGQLSREAMERPHLQSIFVADMLGEEKLAFALTEQAIKEFPNSTQTNNAVGELIARAARAKDFPKLENLSRLARSKFLKPSEALREFGAIGDYDVIMESAILGQADRFLEQKNMDAAIKKYSMLLAEMPGSKRVSLAHLGICRVHESLGKPDLALAALEKYIRSVPAAAADPLVRLRAAGLAEKLKNKGVEAIHLEAYGDLSPADAMKKRTWIKAAKLRLELGQNPRAVADLEAHIKAGVTPEDKLEGMRELGQIFLRSEKFEPLLSVVPRMQEQIRKDPRAEERDENLQTRALALEALMGLKRDAEAEKAALELSEASYRTPAGFSVTSKARFNLGLIYGRKLAAAATAGGAGGAGGVRLKLDAVDRFGENFETVKALLLSVCESSDVRWCSAGYYEVVQLCTLVKNSWMRAIEGLEPSALAAPEAQKVARFIDRMQSFEGLFVKEMAASRDESGAPTAQYEKLIGAYLNASGGPEAKAKQISQSPDGAKPDSQDAVSGAASDAANAPLNASSGPKEGTGSEDKPSAP